MIDFSILQGDQALFLEELYEDYAKDPASVPAHWQDFFRNLENGNGSVTGPAPAQAAPQAAASGPGIRIPQAAAGDHRGAGGAVGSFSLMGVDNLLNTFRRTGHLAANIDPLGIDKPDRSTIDKVLSNFTEEDLDTVVPSPFPHQGHTKLREVIAHLEKTYCSSIGSEHYYLVTEEERLWIQHQLENEFQDYALNTYTKLHLYEKLFQADYFEKFLAKKYVGKKRFSLEGAETTICLLDTAIEEAGRQHIDKVNIGMAHRGRLNVLVNVLEKPAGLIFAEFDENYDKGTLDYADVKYHLGYSNNRTTINGHEVQLSLGFNPSHLEAVNPVIVGKTRAEQDISGDNERDSTMPILIHGDAAFAGQGVVAETLNLGALDGYTVGGTLHILINNQIGFTTLPNESRSTLYATDLAKGFQIPIFHVNGDDPEAVYKVTLLALKYRQRFNKDVIIDLICYRRLGHNETDEPAFTQPEMYRVIRSHKTTLQLYKERLLNEPDVTPEDLTYISEGEKSGLEASFKRAKDEGTKMVVDTMKGRWSDLESGSTHEPDTKTTQLDAVAKAVTTVPEEFKPNKKLLRFLEGRSKMFSGEQKIDWGFAEALAFGSLLEAGHNIRLAGQDSQRGTFTHRHAVMVDTESGTHYIPLNHISAGQGKIEVINSPLSEYAVLGFEYGYSLSQPNCLVIWEAQFGDFANTAQVMFDQFISSSAVKWHRMSGLVILLPHGYEGQGPEHSSARLERFLQMCSDDNMAIVNCSTPAQFFHLMRRQLLRKFRRPLIVMSPKSLLRLPAAGSTLDELTTGSFQEVLDDAEATASKVKRILLCSGKVYYDLHARRVANKDDSVALVRVEELYPFPEAELRKVFGRYKKAEELIFVQEEPKNQGPWGYMQAHLLDAFYPEWKVGYIGRTASASPACGFHKLHLIEQNNIVDEAIGKLKKTAKK